MSQKKTDNLNSSQVTKKALLVGATGLVGGHLLNQLINHDAYTEVHLLLRRPMDGETGRVHHHLVDFQQITTLAVEADEVFCCLGTTIKKAGSQAAFRTVDHDYVLALGAFAKQQGASLSVVSSLGASTKSGNFYLRTKGEMEEALHQLALPRLQLFRPSLMHEGRNESRLGERVAGLAMGLLSPLMMGSLARYRPVDAKDVALAMVLAAQSVLPGRQIFESENIQRIATTGFVPVS